MFCQVIEKEFPLWHLPKIRHFVVIEANHESRDEIEFSPKIGKRLESLNSLDYPADTEQAGKLPEHRQVVDIKANSGMAQQLGNEEEIPRAAAKIENVLGTRQVEFDLANPADVNFDPAVEVEVFWPVCAWVFDGVSLANLLESGWIDCFDDPFCIEREPILPQQPECMLSCAGQAPTIYKLAYFMAKSHRRIDHTL